MARVSINTSCGVSFTDEEKEILQKASEICKKVGNAIWSNSGTDTEDEAAFFFTELGDNLQHALKGDW